MELIQRFINNIETAIMYVRIEDYIDVLVVAFIMYQGILLIRKTRAGQLVKGILIFAVMMIISSILSLYMLNYILINVMQVGIIAIFVLFQPEFRRMLEQLGRSKIGNFIKINEVQQVEQDLVEQCCRAISESVAVFSQEKIGALIVIERETRIDDIIKTGIVTDSVISKELLGNIFIVNTPLHDGAAVIRNCRVAAAACFLPLTQNTYLSSELGARHRAALGMSENSDAIVVISSEETGKISIALDGELSRGLTSEGLFKVLFEMLKPADKRKGMRLPWRKED